MIIRPLPQVSWHQSSKFRFVPKLENLRQGGDSVFCPP